MHSPAGHRAPRHTGRKILIGVAGLALLGVGIGIGAGTASSTTKTVTVNHTMMQNVPVPGPTKTIIKTMPAPAPMQGSTIKKFTGSGNQVTPEFNVPSDGNYIVKWQFSNNNDTMGGGATNFIISTTGTDDSTSGLANDIASQGSGSGEVQMAGSTDSLSIQASDSASWTVTVVAA
jgi:hypothetical protein